MKISHAQLLGILSSLLITQVDVIANTITQTATFRDVARPGMAIGFNDIWRFAPAEGGLESVDFSISIHIEALIDGTYPWPVTISHNIYTFYTGSFNNSSIHILNPEVQRADGPLITVGAYEITSFSAVFDTSRTWSIVDPGFLSEFLHRDVVTYSLSTRIDGTRDYLTMSGSMTTVLSATYYYSLPENQTTAALLVPVVVGLFLVHHVRRRFAPSRAN